MKHIKALNEDTEIIGVFWQHKLQDIRVHRTVRTSSASDFITGSNLSILMINPSTAEESHVSSKPV